MDFFLFILLNAALFIRPSELFPSIDFPVYVYVMYVCLAVSGTRIAARIPSLIRSPIAVCVLGLPVAGVVSHLSRLYFGLASVWAIILLKFLVYFLLMVTVVNTLQRLRSFLRWLIAFTVMLTALAVFHYEGVINIPSLEACQQKDIDPATGELYVIPRLSSTGIFNDPNDLSMVLVLGILLSVYFLDSQRGFLRVVWFAPIGLFVYGLKLTYSRGGLLNLAFSLGVLSLVRFGRKKTAVACVVALPAIAVLFAGRQTKFDFSSSSDTSNGRIQLWVEGLVVFRSSPLFGIGLGEYHERVGAVAHNSYVHTYVEQGFFGGTLFSGAFFTGIWGISRLLRQRATICEPQVERLGPYVLALICSFCLGMYSLSRSETVPAYMVLGIATVYLQITTTYSSMPPIEVDSRFIQRLCAFSIAWLTFIHVFCRVMVRWG
jgi:putative inorganic carbon (hco3(-)) transporter